MKPIKLLPKIVALTATTFLTSYTHDVAAETFTEVVDGETITIEYVKPGEYSVIDSRLGLTEDDPNEASDKEFLNISSTGDSYGGALFNAVLFPEDTLPNVTSSFIRNSVVNIDANAGTDTYGGAFFNTGFIGNINAQFIQNYVLSETIRVAGDCTGCTASGGALYNAPQGNIMQLNGTFFGNYIQNKPLLETGAWEDDDGVLHTYPTATGSSYGGALTNDGQINFIDALFTANHVGLAPGSTLTGTDGYGGAIYNSGKINELKGTFANNYAQGRPYVEITPTPEGFSNVTSAGGTSVGGAIYNIGLINYINANFNKNFASPAEVMIDGVSQIEGNSGHGGAIYNADSSALIGTIEGRFTENYVRGAYDTGGGAIYNVNSAQITAVNATFSKNHVLSKSSVFGGAIYNETPLWNPELPSKILTISGTFSENYVFSQDSWGYAKGGAIYNKGVIGEIINATFTDNYAQSFNMNDDAEPDRVAGGAIYSTEDLKITAQNDYASLFSGNYIKTGAFNEEFALVYSDNKYQAIYMGSDTATLTLNAVTGGSITFNDEIDGLRGYKILITGDEDGSVTFNNKVNNADVTLRNIDFNAENLEQFVNSTLTVESGKLNYNILGADSVINAQGVTVSGGTLNIKSAQADLENAKMGTIENLTITSGKINVESFLIISEMKVDDQNVAIPFMSGSYKDFVTTTGTITQDDAGTPVSIRAIAPIYQYNVTYNQADGSFVFTRNESGGGESGGGESGGGESGGGESGGGESGGGESGGGESGGGSGSGGSSGGSRPGYKAYNPGVFSGDVLALSGLDIQENMIKQVYATPINDNYYHARVWATPYYNSDTIEHDDFYDVDSKNYGLIVGADSRLYTNDYGWRAVYSVFGAYNSGRQEYEKISVDTTSWLIGLKAGVYYGNFYGDAVIDYAYHKGDADTAFGSDSIDAKGYGAALKVGYKYDTYSRWKADTSLMLSYQTVEGSDYTSESGATITTDDYTRISLIPQVKVGYRALKYWTPYALVRYHAILSEDGSSSAKSGALSVALPELESKDYVEYGIGVDTANSGEHSGYAHILRRSLGRSGWSATAGYRYNF